VDHGNSIEKIKAIRYMIKKLLIIGISFILILFLYLRFISISHIEWGHHFSIENNLGIEIDSLTLTIGDEINWLYPSEDSLHIIEGNIDVPTKNYPHRVEIHVYENGNIIHLEADSFNCYNCDGYHEYTLNKAGAVYRFLP